MTKVNSDFLNLKRVFFGKVMEYPTPKARRKFGESFFNQSFILKKFSSTKKNKLNLINSTQVYNGP